MDRVERPLIRNGPAAYSYAEHAGSLSFGRVGYTATQEGQFVLVLHASWLEGALHLWAERWSEGGGGTPPCSPYDPGAEALLEAWRKVSGWVSPVKLGVRTAWLPTAEGRPVHSREVWRYRDAAAPPLAPWQAQAIRLSLRAQFTLLGACQADRRLAPGVMAGADLQGWAELYRYAGALVARGAFLPALAECGGRYEAFWQPVFDGADRARFLRLAARLPSAAQCLTHPGQPVAAAAAGLLAEHFLTEMVDGLVRLSSVTTLSRAHAGKGRFVSAHEAWLATLRGDERRVRWEKPAELAQLAGEIRVWRRAVDLASCANWRLFLRLEESPAEASPARWFLRYLVQPLERPAELRPLASAWEGRDAAAAERGELALTALGQASLLCPLLARSEGAAATTGCHLATGEAHQFLTIYAPLLEAAGMGVGVPSWWQGAENRPRLELLARAEGEESGAGRVFSLATLVAVDWQVVLGGEALTLEELAALGAGGEKLVRFRGRWIEFDKRQADEALRLWKRRRREVRAAGDLVRLLIGVDQQAHGLRIGGVQAHGWVQELLRRLRGEETIEEPPVPDGFRGVLRPYQRTGFAWLAFLRGWRLGACLADDMGLGKTVQTLALLQRERERGEQRPVLLVCPGSVIGNWQHEAARFTPGLTVLRHHGAERRYGAAFAEEAARHALVVTNYALLARDYAALRRVSWAGVVLDEAQNIKNPDTRQSQAARALSAEYRLALTGTPVENHAGELWAIMDFLNPGLLGSRTAFRDRFQRPIQLGTDPALPERLRRATQPFVMRRLKTDRAIIADLPEKIEGRVYCSLSREQAALYAGVLHDLEQGLADASGIARRGLVLSTLLRLKQICNHPDNYLGAEPAGAPAATSRTSDGDAAGGRSGKFDRLCEMIEEVIAAGDRALVFTQFARMGELLREQLGQRFGFEPLFLHGGVSLPERDRMVATWQSDAGPPVFLLSLRAGGTGLNLTRANHVFHFDRWWNPAVENQATDRAFRIGQTRNVMVHKFICAGTLEERIDAMITAKSAMAEAIVGAGETWLTELSDDELKEVLALAPRAVLDAEDTGEEGAP